VDINAALARVNGMSHTVLKQMPPGITPPLILSFIASSVPVQQPSLAPVPGAALPLPFGGKVRQIQADLSQQALHQYGVSVYDVINALSLQNLITPVGTQKIGTYEYTVANASSSLKLTVVGDQSVFVTEAVSSVVRRGASIAGSQRITRDGSMNELVGQSCMQICDW
jgi:Cu/Ag efflux pump CusA